MKKKITLALIIIFSFLIADNAPALIPFSGTDAGSWLNIAITIFNRSLWYIALPALILAFIYGARRMIAELGLQQGFRKALSLAMLATLPMLLGYAWLAGFQAQLTARSLLVGCLLAAVAEEVLFRAFLFGQLYRRVGLPFVLAALPGALFFGIGHLYQGNAIADTAGIFLVTFAGGLWFSWLFKEWNFNLWVPIGLHFLMNFYWTIFQAGDNALGGLLPNVFRGLTIALSIWLTLRMHRQNRMATEETPEALNPS